MRFQHLLEQVYFHPWFITTAGHATIQSLIAGRTSARMGDSESDQDIINRMDSQGIRLSDMVNTRPDMTFDADRIAHIHIFGAVAKNLTKLERACGATGFEQIRQDLADAVQGGARGILLHIDCPGGTVNGTPETAKLIAELNQRIPIVAYGDLICSAAYYMAAGCTAIVAPPSASIGSIGVLIPWVDFAEQMKMVGLVPNPITNKEGDLKATGFRGVLNETETAFMQERADKMFADFKGHVLTYRQIPDTAMRGQWFSGADLLTTNLVDAIGEEPEALALLRSKLG